MEGLSGGDGDDRAGSSPDRDRGQLLLGGAVTLAALLIVLALVLNGATLAETQATASDPVEGGGEAQRFADDVQVGVGTVVVGVNRRNNTSHDALATALSAALGEWDGLAASQAAEGAAGTSVRLANTTNGSRVYQSTSANFTDANGTADWTVAANVSRTRAFELNVTRSSLAASCGAGCFQVVVDNGTANWTVSLTANNTSIHVGVDGPAGAGTCSVEANATRVHLTEGEVGGEPCEALSFAAGIDGDYDVRYENATAVNGTYELVVDADVADDGRYADQPAVTPAIYDATVVVSYRTERLYYQTTVRAAPEEGSDD